MTKLLASLLAALVSAIAPGFSTVSAPGPVPGRSVEVTYPGVAGVRLAGTLVVPAHRRGTRVPGVVIVAGSGSIDRNGNDVPAGVVTDLYSQLAADLAAHGVASLRYDKRGLGGSTPVPPVADPHHPTPAELLAIERFIAWDHFVGDAAMSLRELQLQPDIAPEQTAMLGHSEGSTLCEEVATDRIPGVRPPAALILAGAPGRHIQVVLREQIANLLQGTGAAPAAAAFTLSEFDEEITDIERTGHVSQAPVDAVAADPQVPALVRSSFAHLFAVGTDLFYDGEVRVDPAQLLPRYRGPVLVLQGTADVNVFAAEDTPLIDQALASRPHDRHLTLLARDASHFLKRFDPTHPETYLQGPVVPEVLTTLPAWFSANVGTR